MPCKALPDTVDGLDLMAHQRIAFNVLPYAIQQKNKKYHRKAIGAVPVLATIPMLIRHAYRAGTKVDKGKQREAMAHELAEKLRSV
jgi:hypothetical protein